MQLFLTCFFWLSSVLLSLILSDFKAGSLPRQSVNMEQGLKPVLGDVRLSVCLFFVC